MPELWTAAELINATGGRFEGNPPEVFGGVAIDSRSLAPGDIFIAIKGENRDGHEFAASALEAGAGVAIVSRPSEAMRARGALLVVDEPLAALERLGIAARARTGTQVIAVTGSVGKTSTKEALRLALSAEGETHASAASYNNHWGVPLSLARMKRGAKFAVFEIGMNHSGEIIPLVKIVKPHVAIITAIAASHLGNFDSLEDIADAKAEIFSGVEPGGAAMLNRDNVFYERLAEAARRAGIERVHSFGKDPSADIRLVQAVLHENCSCLTASVFGEEVLFKLGMPGEHVVMNSLAVLGAVKLVGADLARAAVSLATLSAAKGRGVRHKLALPGGYLTLIDESYNANPSSMRAALAVLSNSRPGKGGKRIAVLGDMLELGEKGPVLHADLANAIDASGADALYACGPLMRHLWEAVPASRRGKYAANSDELKKALIGALGAGDVVMVKGSLGSRMGPLVEAIRERFPPAEGMA
ncbi:MAG TPA: UDP-N-acetylmuramoylalanyl-D-glutamyl-2,6-diaminopimelate--D-alanyl-D-alanine ligase [Aestuariivirgaceae bacterium]|nr:UDP-N-acetylmuramoylalanyl-D-glutamyl-2,6-diaminopimelate--D-alanyl-D-alanine ligase [Aestuariivirgaceae bacterium]